MNASEVRDSKTLDGEMHDAKVPEGKVHQGKVPEGEVHEGEAHGSEGDERDAHQDEVQPATEPARAEASQAVASPEQVTATTTLPASVGLTGEEPHQNSPRETPAPTGQVDTAGARRASSHQEHVGVQERAEPTDRIARTDASNEARGEISASEAGAKPAAKPEQVLPAAPQTTTAGLPSAPSAATAHVPAVNVAQAQNAPIRVVSEVPLGAVPVEIGLKSLAGINHFEIRLEPAELGRIEVRLEIDQEGGVKAHLSVDRVETLALLQRDARTLERAFDQAGLKLSDGSVDLSLRDQQAQGQGRHEHAGDQRRDGSRHSSPDMRRDDADPALTEVPRRLWRGAARVDVRI